MVKKRKRPCQHTKKIWTKRGRKRITINRGIPKTKRKRSRFFRAKLETEGFDFSGSLKHKKMLQNFFRKYPEHIKVARASDKMGAIQIIPQPSWSVGANISLHDPEYHQPEIKSPNLRVSGTLFSQKKAGPHTLKHSLKHELGHLKDFKSDPKKFLIRFDDETELDLPYNQLPSEIIADKYARKIPQRKIAQFKRSKLKGEKAFQEIFK